MEIDCGTDVTFDGGENISVFKSSQWAERGFCKNCGTHLFYRIQQTGQHIVPIGLFEASDDLTFETQVFIDEKPSYYAAPAGTLTLDDELIATGRLSLHRAASDSGVYLGWLNAAAKQAKLTPDHEVRQTNYLAVAG